MLTIIMVVLAGFSVLFSLFCLAAATNSRIEALANHLGAIIAVLLAILFILVAILFKPVY